MAFLDTARLRHLRAYTDYTASDKQQDQVEHPLRGGLQRLRETLEGVSGGRYSGAAVSKAGLDGRL